MDFANFRNASEPKQPSEPLVNLGHTVGTQ